MVALQGVRKGKGHRLRTGEQGNEVNTMSWYCSTVVFTIVVQSSGMMGGSFQVLASKNIIASSKA